MKPGQVMCVCGPYWPKQAWKHAACAINAVPAINGGAINGPVSLGAYTPGCGAPVATAEDLAQPLTVTTTTPNRRDRKAYNDYMRRYMKEDREKRRAGRKPLGIPYG